MRKLLLICFFISIALFSCKKNEIVVPLQVGTIKDHLVNEKQAIKIAVLKSIFNRSSNPQNRMSIDKSVQKTVKNTTLINFDQEAPAFYIINYNEGGFIIVAGDDRSMPILAESDTKDFPIVKDAYYPGGLVQWLENTNDAIKTIRVNNLPQDSVQKMAWQEIEYQTNMTVKPNDVDPVLPGSCSTEGASYSTLLQRDPVVQSTWAQWVGYNDALPNMGCPLYSNGRPPVGCVATATAQIMRYYQYPLTFSWSSMSLTSGTSATAALMADIGSKVSMSYGCDGSSAYTSDAATALRNNYGYTSATYNSTYNYTTVRNELVNHRPVILSGGRASKWLFFNVYADGHAWVADGMKEYTYYTCHVSPYPGQGGHYFMDSQSLQFHMNWGWGGQYDGYYAFNNFNPGSNTFNYKTAMITNIRPLNEI